MQVPVQVDYGVRALVDLAQNAHESSVRASDIARRQGIPRQFLDRVMLQLQRNGLTKAQRGPAGGHSLARPPSEITMGAVMSCLGNPVVLVTCMDDAGNCEHAPSCGQRSVWQDVETAIWSVLNGTTISDIVERMQAQELEEAPA